MHKAESRWVVMKKVDDCFHVLCSAFLSRQQAPHGVLFSPLQSPPQACGAFNSLTLCQKGHTSYATHERAFKTTPLTPQETAVAAGLGSSSSDTLTVRGGCTKIVVNPRSSLKLPSKFSFLATTFYFHAVHVSRLALFCIP